MGERANTLANKTCYHGNAGIASAFAALAYKKMKPGGVLALVLPLSAAVGLSWQGFRKMLADHYTGLTVLTIAAADNDDLSFSSDTGMAECLVIARGLKPDEPPDDVDPIFVSHHRVMPVEHGSFSATQAHSMRFQHLNGGVIRRISL